MNYIFVFDLISVFFFGVSGTITAYKYNKLDLFGLGFVGFITAIGGGTVRDMILDAHPIAWVSHPAYFIAITCGVFCALVFMQPIQKFSKPFVTMDAIAIAFAGMAGFEKSLEYGANPLAAMLLGVTTATVGGVIRDMICNEIPMVLRKEIYASAVFAGCSTYLVLYSLFGLDLWIAEVSGFFVIIIMRLSAVYYQWNLDLTSFRMMRRHFEIRKNKIKRKLR